MFENNINNAEENGLLAFEYSQKNTADVDVARIANFLSELYFKKNDIDKAYHYLSIAHNLDAAIFNDKK